MVNPSTPFSVTYSISKSNKNVNHKGVSMTKNEIKTTLTAVLNTLDNGLTIRGVSNMTAIVGCCQAIQNVVNSIDELSEDETTNEV
jgi:hypothetical protein